MRLVELIYSESYFPRPPRQEPDDGGQAAEMEVGMVVKDVRILNTNLL